MAKNKIKILQTIRQGKIGGGESHVIDLVEALDKDRYESVVLSFTEGPMVEHMKSIGVKTYVIPTEKPFDYSKWEEVKKIIDTEKIDLVHAHGTRANSNTNNSARKLGIPLIYTVHGWSFHPDQNFLVRALRVWSEKYLVNKSTLTICVSDSNLKDACDLFEMKRATVVKCGINLNKYNPDAASFLPVRKELGIEDDVVLVGYIVRMTIQKDPLTLIRAIALLPDNPKLKFLFVGDGDLKDDVISLAKELKVSSRIFFMDFRQDVPNILNAINIYCLPSLWEGLPLGMLEAMAMRKAIVATAIDGTKEVINNMENGIVIPVKSPQKLADALLLLAGNKELRASMGIKARETIEHDFNIEQMTRRIEKLYGNLTE
jgi:glycosyltransferase involved in cell wall biosynthesis